MRPYDSDYDDLDDFEVPGVRSIRHMINERQRDELQLRGRRLVGPFGKIHGSDDDWDEFNDSDYDADEFDRYSGLDFDSH